MPFAVSDLTAKFLLDISQARTALAEIKRAGVAALGGQGKLAMVGQAQAATREMSQAQGVASRLFSVVRSGARAAVGIGAIVVALVALNRRFPVIGEVAGKAFGLIKTNATSAGKATGTFFQNLASYIPKAAKAALAIRAVVAAFRALRGAPKPEDIKLPKPSGGGGGFGLGRLMPALGGVALAAGLFATVKEGVSNAIQGAAEAEQLQVGFEVLTGGLAPAKKALAELRALSEKTPLSFQDVSSAGRSLLAFGEDKDAMAGTLKRIGDVAMGVQAPLGEIAEIYGKARVQGTLFAEDINQLTGRGIPILTEFAGILGTTPAAIKKMASEGKITFPMLEKAFQNMTSKGGLFSGMMEKMSRTVLGLWSTLKDNIQTALTAFGQPVNDALRPLLKEAVDLAASLKGKAAEFGEAVAQAIDFLRAAMQTLAASQVWQIIGKGLQLGFQSALDFLGRGFAALFAALSQPGRLTSWKNAFMEMAADFGDALLRAIETAMQGLAAVQGVGSLFSQAAKDVAQQREMNAYHRDEARYEDVKEGNIIVRRLKSAGASGAMEPFLESFKKAFASMPGLNTESNARLSLELAAALKPVLEQAAKNTAERKTEGKEDDSPISPRDGLIPTGIASAGGTVAGAFQRATNLLLGKTVNDLVAEEAKTTNKLLTTIRDTEERTKRATEEIVINTRKPPTPTVEVVPVFV